MQDRQQLRTGPATAGWDTWARFGTTDLNPLNTQALSVLCVNVCDSHDLVPETCTIQGRKPSRTWACMS